MISYNDVCQAVEDKFPGTRVEPTRSADMFFVIGAGGIVTTVIRTDGDVARTSGRVQSPWMPLDELFIWLRLTGGGLT